MKIRRTIVWVISAIFGIIAAAGVIVVFRSNFTEFTVGLFPGDLPLVLLLSFASLAFIWLDFILRTEYLRS
ncbi:MAG: hypothetical protein A2Z37_12430 [Chloroflexi bacterium RBG_19FT_COMBO_62_14]|nr:MAG: hypothetical protein A2Z37_12430 [Chloroflexi bacterium RBG_19FT_COMBO_62_14]